MRALSLTVLLTSLTASASAQRLHVYGPEGNGHERRCIVVVERADGTCVPAQDISLSSAEGVVTLEESAGECARWLSLGSASQTALTLRADIEGSPTAAVELGPPPMLAVQLERHGTRLQATVDGVAPDVRIRAWASWRGGRTELERTDEGLQGEVPPDVLVGVVVRAGDRMGAASLAPAIGSQADVLLIPSDLVLSAGGAPRPVAFLVVADARGRLSRSVPLHIQSERGVLARLSWIENGLAEVWLSASVGVASVDLSVESAAAAASIELATQSGWPGSATLMAPPSALEQEEVEVQALVAAVDGSAITSGIGVRWGDLELRSLGEGRFAGRAPRENPPLIAFADIDGERVPLTSVRIEVALLEPVPAQDVLPLVLERPRVVPTPLRLAVGASFAIDLWARTGTGALCSLRVQLLGPWWLEVWARYQATFTLASGQDLVTEDLLAVTHSAEVAVLSRVVLGGWPLGIFGGVGLAADGLDGRVGSRAVQSIDATGFLIAGLGVTVRLDGISFAFDGYARASTALSDAAWNAPWLRVGFDLTGGFDVTP